MAGHTESDSEADTRFDDYLSNPFGGHESDLFADYEADSKADGAVSEHSVDSKASDIASEHSSESEEADSELFVASRAATPEDFIIELPSPLQSPATDSSGSNNDLASYASSEDEAIPNPPSSITATTIQKLQEAVNNWSRENDIGFAVIRRNGKKKKAGQWTKYNLECDRAGERRKSESVGLRKPSSRKCGCKWKVTAVYSAGMWSLQYNGEPKHNHARSIDSSAHPQHRKRPAEIVEAIASISLHPGIRARDVGNIISTQFPGTCFKDADIYNERAKLRRERRAGRTATGALVAHLDEMDIPHKVLWVDEEKKDELVGLVFTYDDLLVLTQLSWEVAQCDMTYSTNLYGYPLFQVTGQTSCNTTFTSFFGLINSERREAFDFVFGAVKELRAKAEVPILEPLVWITDYCQEMKASLAALFPDSQQQICVYHIIKNVLLNAKRKFKHAEEPNSADEEEQSDEELSPAEERGLTSFRKDQQARPAEDPVRTSNTPPIQHNHHGVEAMFRVMLYAETEEDFFKAWVALKQEFADKPAILHYLQKQWLPLRSQWARCYIKKYRNFGFKVTSATESANLNVKSHLVNGRSNTLTLFDALNALVQRQLKVYIDRVAYESTKTKLEYHGKPYLGKVPLQLSFRALGLIHREYKYALAAFPAKNRQPSPLQPCSPECTVSLQYGIPCRHTLFNLLEAKKPIRRWHVLPRWHLKVRLDEGDPYMKVRDPKVAEKRRGRPRNKKEPMPSQYAVEPGTEAPARTHSWRVGRSTPGSRSPPKRPTKKRQKATHPGPTKGNAPRLAPSIRRRLSRFELEVTPPRRQGRRPRNTELELDSEQSGPESEDSAPEPESPASPRAGPRTTLVLARSKRPRLLLTPGKESGGRATAGETGGNTGENNGSDPERPAKRTRSGRTVQLTRRLQGLD